MVRRLAPWVATWVLAAVPALAGAGEVMSPSHVIDRVTLQVEDLTHAEAWYASNLGFEALSRDEHSVTLGRATIKLLLTSVSTPGSGMNARAGLPTVPLKFDAAEFSAAVAVLRAHGTPVEVTSDFEHQNGAFQDPDGNSLAITAQAPDGAAQPSAAVTWLADVLLDHLEATNFEVRMQRHLPLDRLPDLSADAARREADFNRQMLQRLDNLRAASLPHGQQLLASSLRHSFQAGSTADQDYWFHFAVTPYAGAGLIQAVDDALAAAPVGDTADRDRYLNLLDAYATVVNTIREKSLLQAQRGIRVPKPALPGVLATLNGLRSSAETAIRAAAANAPEEASAAEQPFKTRVHERVEGAILPAYDALIAVFGENYSKRAPAQVGVGQYPGGKDFYRRRIFSDAGVTVQPEAIHELGLRGVGEARAQLAKIRAALGFKGDRNAFQTFLRTDPRFLARTPAEVEARYRSHIDRIVPMLPRYFAVLPRAPYGFERLDPAAEPGMTYGYYYPPTGSEPRGLYHYNGSNLSHRSLVISAHLIYHELLPGHHLQFALATENESLHPVLALLSVGAYEEGWAEYAAQLALEMGAMQDPYDRYGHLLAQSFTASRLVVDTGMNYLGWPLGRARQFMQQHCFLSDMEIASETLRYSTDIPGQALGYRLGYEAIMDGRKRAEAALGNRFDMRAFNTAVSGNGEMPLNVLEQQVDWFSAHGRAQR